MEIKNIINKVINILGYRIVKKFTISRDSKNSTLFVKQNLKKELVVAEIGTQEGINAENILNNLDIKTFYIIDPYCYTSEDYDNDSDNNKRASHKFLLEAERQMKKTMSKFKDVEIIFIRKTSDDAVEDLPDNLDFIYIDGEHSYKQVKKDMENYYPKVKEGGVLAGHDIVAIKDVGQAFVEFIQENSISDYRITSDDWIIYKSENEQKQEQDAKCVINELEEGQ